MKFPVKNVSRRYRDFFSIFFFVFRLNIFLMLLEPFVSWEKYFLWKIKDEKLFFITVIYNEKFFFSLINCYMVCEILLNKHIAWMQKLFLIQKNPIYKRFSTLNSSNEESRSEWTWEHLRGSRKVKGSDRAFVYIYYCENLNKFLHKST